MISSPPPGACFFGFRSGIALPRPRPAVWPRPPRACPRWMPRREELAAMIRHDLSNVDRRHRRGVIVTVYGLNPWNSMLTFGVDAGPVPNKADLQSFCDIITERLKRLYDVYGLARA